MGQQQSKDELLFQQVNYGNLEGIKSLHGEGAGLEWVDKEAKTPLIAACMNPELYNVAKTLIELGANVNAYRPGRHAGTPLHHAAKRGLEQTTKLLLSNGANALVMNDECQTPLDVARVKGYSNVVRTIESHICLFSGSLRELYGPGFLELFAPQLLSRIVWVVVLPCGSRNLSKPFKLELAIYSSSQDAQPRAVIALWKANLEESNSNQPDPTVIISDNSSIPRRWKRRRGIISSKEARCKPRRVRQTRIKFAPANENDKQQLQWFCNACKGIPQVFLPAFPFNTQAPGVPATAPPSAEDAELTTAINASLQTAMYEISPLQDSLGFIGNASTSQTHSSDSRNHAAGSATGAGKGSSEESGPSGNSCQHVEIHGNSDTSQTIVVNHVHASIPSAPLIADSIVDEGPICYPSIDSSPVDLSPIGEEILPTEVDGRKNDSSASSSSCVICLDAPVEGACVPCGHMAGCMSCLDEIKGKKWGCPVCRARIDQVIRLYAV